MSKKEVIIKILEELYDNSNLLTLQDLNIDKNLYSEILEIMARSGLIMNYESNKSQDGNLMYQKNVRITIGGMEYLENKTRRNYNEEILEELRTIAQSLNSIILKNIYN